MLSEAERQLIEDVQQAEDISLCVKIASESGNPHFLQQYAAACNWDDGLEIVDAIAENPSCDLGTALSLFWLADAMSLLTGAVEPDEYNRPWVEFCNKLTTRLATGVYQPGSVSFDPPATKVEVHKWSRQGVAAVFYSPVSGNGM
jgi:hypothetical protein